VPLPSRSTRVLSTARLYINQRTAQKPHFGLPIRWASSKSGRGLATRSTMYETSLVMRQVSPVFHLGTRVCGRASPKASLRSIGTDCSASMDKTAIWRSFADPTTKREIPHDTYVHSILPIPPTLTARSLVLTGCGDDDLRLWESDDEWKTYRLVSRIQGHCGAVTAIRTWTRSERDVLFISGDLDGTLRQWSLDGW
jgi:WD40 repeat protein